VNGVNGRVLAGLLLAVEAVYTDGQIERLHEMPHPRRRAAGAAGTCNNPTTT
jgi:hypothetical protein